MADSRCLVLSLLFCTFSLQGCDASQMNMLSVFIGICGAMAALGTVIMGCLAMSQPPHKAKKTCLRYGVPAFIAMVAIWVGFGLLVAHMNCTSFRSYEGNESCEWLDPPPGGFSLEDCCVSVPTASPDESDER